MKFNYYPKGVCSRESNFIIEDDKIVDLEIIGGCHGNLQGIKSLILDQDVDYVIKKLKGIHCGMKSTSCPDQIAKALEQYKLK